MVIDTNKESLNINKIVCEKEEIILVEGDMIVPDSKPDILSAMNTSGNICIYKKELMDEKLKIDGSINAYIMYIADNSEGIVRGINTNLDYSNIIDVPNCRQDMILDMDSEIKSLECNVINGRKISVKARINVKIKVYTNENVELINDISDNKDIQVLKNTTSVNSLVGYGNTKAYVKDTIMIDNTDNLAEILKVDINLVDRDTKTSYNKVLAKSEAEIKIMYLTEENKVATCTNKLPIVGFIDIQDVTENNVCDTNFEIRNMIIKPNSVEEHSIYIEIEIEVSCMAYEEKKLNLLEDLYSPVEDLNCNKKEIIAIADKQIRTETCSINETVNLPELEESTIIDVECKPKIMKVNKLNSKINYEGDINLTFTILKNDAEVKVEERTVPFEFIIDKIKDGEKFKINTRIEVVENEYVIKTGGDVEINLKLIFNIGMFRNENINIVDNIDVAETNNSEDYSLVIYIIKPGDTLWSIAKNLRSTVEDIVKANAIEDENKIKPGEKLYIPRYVKYA